MFPSTFTHDSGFVGTGGTQFGAGGGFVPSQGNEPSPGVRKFHQQTIRAVTIRQIQEATSNIPDDNIVLDGEELNNLTFVARVVRLVENSTNFDIKVEDGTGQWDVKLYVDAEEETADVKRRECQPGQYVRIHGHLRPMDDKYPLVAFSVKQIIDYNEVAFHFLSCIYQHAHFTRGAARATGGAPASAVKPPNAGGNVLSDGDKNDTPVIAAVRQVFRSTAAEIPLAKVVESLGGRFNPMQIRDAISALADQGCVYTTADDVYKGCEM